jgi:hypothetical protein
VRNIYKEGIIMPHVYNKVTGMYLEVLTSVQQMNTPGFRHAVQDVRKSDMDVIRPIVAGGRTVKTNTTLPAWEPAKLKDPGTLCAKRVECPMQLNYSTDPTYAQDYKAGVAYARTQEKRAITTSLGQGRRVEDKRKRHLIVEDVELTDDPLDDPASDEYKAYWAEKDSRVAAWAKIK